MQIIHKAGTWIGHHKKLSIGIAAGAVVLCVAVWVIGWPMLMRAKMQNGGETAAFIRTTVLTKTTLEDTISATGTVESADVSNVTTQLKYKVKSVEVQVGDDVVAGDVICVLDTGDLDEQIAEARERMAEELESLEDAVERAEDNLDSIDSNAYSQYSSAKNKYTTAKAEYDKVEAMIAEEQAAYDNALDAYETAYDDLLEGGGDPNALEKELDNPTAQVKTVAEEPATVSEEEITTTSEEETSSTESSTTESNSNTSTEPEKSEELKALEEKFKTAYNDKKAALTALEAEKTRVNYNSIYSTYSSALSAYNSADSALDSYYDRVESAQESLEQAEENLAEGASSDTLDDLLEQLEECALRAETSGKVTALNVTVGDTVNGTVATIQNTSDLKIAISIAEYDIASVEVGMKAVITSDSIDGELSGVLSQISPVASGGGGTSSTFAAEVSVDGNGGGLHIGVNAKVEIILSATDDVFVVPIDAVEYPDNSGIAYVYVKTGGEGLDATFEQVAVETGASTDYYIEIYGDNIEEGMEVRSSANLEEATSTDDGGRGGLDAMIENRNQMIGNMVGGGNMPSMPSGGGMPSGGPPSGGGMPNFG